MTNIRTALMAGCILSAPLPLGQALAQEPPEAVQQSAIEEIVVTARKREENLQDTPLAITAVSAATLEARGIENFIDISRITPNLKVNETPGSLGAAAIYLRGISFGDNLVGNDLPIGYYIDGVSYGRVATAGLDLIEPDSVQVLRGPQGTLFGRNTTGGAILVQTHTPTDEFSGAVRSSWGSFRASSLRARIDTGYIGDSTIKASFAYVHRQRDGNQDNIGQPGYLDPGAMKTDAYWGKLIGEFGAFKATLSADHTEVNGVPNSVQIVDASPALKGYLAASPSFGGNTVPITSEPLFRLENYAQPLLQRVTQKGIQLTLDYAANENLAVKAIGAARGYYRNDPNNYGPSDLRGPTTTGVVKSFPGFYGVPKRFQKQNQKSLELQFLGNYDQFNFVIGLYYFDESARDYGDTRFPFVISPSLANDVFSPREYFVDSKSKAAFGQVDWRPQFAEDKLEISAGIRYTDDSREFSQVTPIIRKISLKGNNWSYQVSANYKFTDGLMAYARYSTGYRAGGLNARTTDPAISAIYEPEKIRAWEAGFKLDALDRRLRLNVAGFFNKYKDLQTTQFAAPDNVVGGGSININANAEFKGVEAELTLMPVDGLTLAGSFGYVHSQYKSYPRPLATGGVVYSGCSPVKNAAGATVLQDCGAASRFTNSPDTQWDINATYLFPRQTFGEVSLAVNYSWRAGTHGVALPAASIFADVLEIGSYGLLGARFAIGEIPLAGDARGSIAIFGDNLADDRYASAATDLGFAALKNFPSRRTFGIEGKVTF